MKSAWLHQRRNRCLIIFCNGWGMDANPFLPLGANDYDVLMLFDYNDLTLDEDPELLFQHYQRTYLVSWSMGVWVGQQIFQPWSHRLQGAMAINGTLCPIDDQFGIPGQLYGATLERYSAASRLKFYRRMCRDHQAFDTFLQHQPARSVENQRLELEALQSQVSCQVALEAIYTKVLIADQDLVVPAANQIAFWQGQESLQLKGAHFLFYRWNSWDELMDMFV